MISNIRKSCLKCFEFNMISKSRKIQGHTIKTPLHLSERLSDKYNCEVYLKREDLQKTRSFKLRGSLNKIIKNYDILKSKDASLWQCGNHAQGVVTHAVVL